VDLKLPLARTPGTNNSFFDFSRIGVNLPIPVRKTEQRRCWQFNIHGSPGYIAEIFTTQTCDYDKGTSPKPRIETWGAQIFHEQWDTLFNENQNLEIGERTTWEPTESQFFSIKGSPWYDEREGMEYENGSGYKELLHIMEVVKKVIMSEVTGVLGTVRDRDKDKGRSEVNTRPVDMRGPAQSKDLSTGHSAPTSTLGSTDAKITAYNANVSPITTSLFAQPPVYQGSEGPWGSTPPDTVPTKSTRPLSNAGSPANGTRWRSPAKAPPHLTTGSRSNQQPVGRSKGKQPAGKSSGSKSGNQKWGNGSRTAAPTAPGGSATGRGRGRARFDVLGEMEA
jgi:hypothetical protein